MVREVQTQFLAPPGSGNGRQFSINQTADRFGRQLQHDVLAIGNTSQLSLSYVCVCVGVCERVFLL